MTLAHHWARERRIVLRPDPRRFAPLLLIGLALVALGVWMGLSADDLLHRTVGWLGMVFCGLGLLGFAAQFVPGASSLTLDPQGVTVVNLWRRQHHRWPEVEGFRVRPLGRQLMILFDVPGSDGRAVRMNRLLFGVSHALPDSYGLRPEQLAAFMALVRGWAAEPPAS